MFDWAIGGLGELFGFVGDAVGGAVGWAWDKVITGIYTWLANGLALLIEWVWSVLDSGTTPRVTAGWFRNELSAQVAVIALAVTVAMMLASATQAALAGRPEQIGDAVKEGARAIVASALTLTVLDVLIGVTDEAAAVVWQTGRPDLVQMLENMVVVATTTGPLGSTFVGPLCLLVGFIGLIGLVIALMNKPDLLILDEPSSGLDPLMQQTFNELMLEAQKAGQTVFLSSHILSEVQAICDRVGILRDGQLKAVQRVSDMTHTDFRWVTLRLREAIEPAQLSGVSGVSDVSHTEDGLRLRLTGDFDPLLRAITPYYVSDIKVQEPTLEEIFLTFYGNNGQPKQEAARVGVAS